MRSFLIKSSFQRSSIPLFHVGGNTQQPQKTLLISISCTNSDTYIQGPVTVSRIRSRAKNPGEGEDKCGAYSLKAYTWETSLAVKSSGCVISKAMKWR
jgi:hypothetical protein